MNAQFLGAWDVAPRSHPGDGLLDVLEAEVGLDERLKIRERLPSLRTAEKSPSMSIARIRPGNMPPPTVAATPCS